MKFWVRVWINFFTFMLSLEVDLVETIWCLIEVPCLSIEVMEWEEIEYWECFSYVGNSDLWVQCTIWIITVIVWLQLVWGQLEVKLDSKYPFFLWRNPVQILSKSWSIYYPNIGIQTLNLEKYPNEQVHLAITPSRQVQMAWILYHSKD